MYKAAARITTIIPVMVNHNAPFFSIKSPNFLPKRLVKYETKKNRNPLVSKQIKKKTVILKPNYSTCNSKDLKRKWGKSS
jgi:hypothetical protein